MAEEAFRLIPFKMGQPLEERGLDPCLQQVLIDEAYRLLHYELPEGLDKVDWEILQAEDKTPNSEKRPVEILAKLHNAGDSVDGLEGIRTIGGTETGTVVTGVVSYSNIQTIHSQVKSLKRARPVSLHLAESVPAIHCREEDLRAAFPNVPPAAGSSNVIIGVVDRGCDFAHRNFRHRLPGPTFGMTRLLSLWDQRGGAQGGAPTGFQYGRELSAAQINAALPRPRPYEALSYELEARAHGTSVLDIAAGNGWSTKAPGVAPNADLIFVELDGDDETAVGSFGNSRHVLDAVDYIFAKAGDRPVVVNLSLGTHGGPHDGTTPVEQAFEELLNQKEGRAIVLAAGNTGGQPIHAQGKVRQQEDKILTWSFSEGAVSAEECEIWYDGQVGDKTGLDIHLTPPGRAELPTPIEPGQTYILAQGTKMVGSIVHRKEDPNNLDNQAYFKVPPPEAGVREPWRIRLSTLQKEFTRYHAWLERDEFRRSAFPPDEQTNTHGLGSICCGESTIVVGSCNAHLEQRPASPFSAPGPLRKQLDGPLRKKPEILAPGDEIATASARSLSAPVVASGTSLAAAHVTGLVALLFQLSHPRLLSIKETRETLIWAARRNPADLPQDLQIGHGRVDGIDVLRSLFGTGQPAAAAPRPPLGLQPVAADGNGHASANGQETPLQREELIAALQKAISHLSPPP